MSPQKGQKQVFILSMVRFADDDTPIAVEDVREAINQQFLALFDFDVEEQADAEGDAADLDEPYDEEGY